MRAFLLFNLYAPLASWGNIAVGESRGSWDRPSRSAILGLIAAALGIDRENQAAHDALNRDYGVAVRLDAPGTTMEDYHTAQTVSSSIVKRMRPATRAELLNATAGDWETILSRRTYRQDALATVALWTVEGSDSWSLAELAGALERPKFALYAGRKSNPLGLPLAPKLLESDTLAQALLTFATSRGTQEGPNPSAAASILVILERLRPERSQGGGWAREVSHDPCEGFESGLEAHRREVRRDTAPHRGRWHFAERVVEVGLLPQMGQPSAGFAAEAES